MVGFTARRVLATVLWCPGMLLITSCGSSESSFCNGIKSVSGFVGQFSQGLDNFAEDRYTQLRLDSLDALETTVASTKDETHGEDARELEVKVNDFITAMDDVSWDVSQALESNRAIEAATVLGTEETLTQANSVESVVIARCGLPTTLPPNVASDTLPFPSVPAPTATDPPTREPSGESEFRATGQMVASQFGLTLTDTAVICLGRELENVYGDGSDGQVQSVFQPAFDVCGINFTVPGD